MAGMKLNHSSFPKHTMLQGAADAASLDLKLEGVQKEMQNKIRVVCGEMAKQLEARLQSSEALLEELQQQVESLLQVV
jgi:hypothetical protein